MGENCLHIVAANSKEEELLEMLGLVWNLRQPPADRAKWLRADWKAAHAAKAAKAKAPPAYPVDVRG